MLLLADSRLLFDFLSLLSNLRLLLREFTLVLSSRRGLLCPLCHFKTPLFCSLGLNGCQLLCMGSLDFSKALLTLAFRLKLSLLLSFERCNLSLLLFALLVLLLLFEDDLELLDGAAMLFCQLLKLGAMLLLLPLLLGLLIFLVLAQQLRHQLICLLARVVEHLLVVFQDLDSLEILELLDDGQGRVTCVVPLEGVKLGVLDNVLEHFHLGAMLSSEVADIVACSSFTDLSVCIAAEKKSHAV